ncbi:MAG TPA: CRISPR-associated endoribonuclease Cas6 [Desulfurobacteriaceae bacterium]|nr:CRISPR-associated endoribonuclease Cas6 [Desulfurobacteriaceae bacterium]
MRLKVNLVTEKNSILDFNYQYYLYSSICNLIKNIDMKYASYLHDKKGFKFFTFSRLFVKNRKILKEGIEILDGKLHFYLSSPSQEFIQKFVKALFENRTIRIKNLKCNIDTVELIKTPNFKNKVLFKTLSPICLRTKKKINGKIKDYEILPDDELFKTNLIKNLIKKFEVYYNEKCKYKINDINILSSKPKRIKIKDLYFRCAELVFEIEGDKELIKFGYECGFGEKNSMGFGMVEKVK